MNQFLLPLLLICNVFTKEYIQDAHGNQLNLLKQENAKEQGYGSDPNSDHGSTSLQNLFQKQSAIKNTLNDPCKNVNNKNATYLYDDVINCYESFKFDNKIRDGVLDTLWKFLPFYVFADVAKKRSVDAIKGGKTIDMENMLAAIRVKSYTNDRDFQMDVSDLFMELRDGHTQYIPQCYTKFLFLLPFPLVLIEQEGQLLVKVRVTGDFSPNQLNIWKQHGIDVDKFDGAIVEKIDNESPIKAIENIADTRYGTSRDPHARMNGALAGFKIVNGVWLLDSGEFAQTKFPPKKKQVSFLFNLKGKKVNVTAPYLAQPNYHGEFKDSDDYFKQYCLKKEVDYQAKINEMNQTGDNSNKKANDQIQQLKELLNKPIEITKEEKKIIKRKTIDLSQPISDGIFSKFYIFNNNIGVLVLNEFDSTINDLKFKQEILSGFKLFEQLKVQKLILDLSNNGGGTVCHGYSIAKYLMPKNKFKPFRLDMHMNPILTNLLLVDNEEDSAFNPRSKLRPNNTFFNDVSEFIPKGEERWDVENRYTNFFHNNCASEDFMSLLSNKTNHLAFQEKDITLITNSKCYSTCGLFVNTLQELSNILTYSVGGTKMISNRLPTAGSMNGANVVSHEDLLLMFTYFNLTSHPLAPKPFPIQAKLSMTLMQAYSHFPDHNGLPIPLEFLARPSDKHFYNDQTTVNQPQNIWLRIAAERGYLNMHRPVKKVLKKVDTFFKAFFGNRI